MQLKDNPRVRRIIVQNIVVWYFLWIPATDYVSNK